MTRELIGLLLVDVLLAGGMIICGLETNRLWPGVGMPSIGLGIAVGMGALYILKGSRPRALEVDGEGVSLRTGGKVVRVRWETFRTFLPHATGRRFLRRTVMGDGRRRIVVDSLHFPEYDELVAMVAHMRLRFQREVGRIA